MTLVGGLNQTSDSTTTGLIAVAAALMTVGAVMAWSTGAALDRSLIEASSLAGPAGRQAMFAVGAFATMVILSHVDIGVLRWKPGRLVQWPVVMLMIAVGLLLAVWLPTVGHASHGRNRWINLGPIGFQPSELAKPAMVVFVAGALTMRKAVGRSRVVRPHVAVVGIGVLCALVGVEDFGTAALLGMVGGLMLLAGGCRLRDISIWAIPGAAAFAALLFSHPYRVKRLFSFLHVWDDPQGAGYHAIQSLVAIASGGWTGVGLGAGLAQHGYLPEARTDFVFSVLCEESGFLGGVTVILLFVALIYFGLRVMTLASQRGDDFARLFAFGVTATIGLQALINLSVVTVMAPTKGIALPFVSAGGSGVLCLGASVGLLAGMSRRYSMSAAICTVPVDSSYDAASGAFVAVEHG